MIVEVLSKFRKFKEGEVFEFKMPVTIIVGDNGSGKSSLLQAIRGKLELVTLGNQSLFKSDFIKLSKNIKVITDIEHFLFFDSIKDDGGNMNNAYDALSFIDGGGFHTNKLSHGETQLYHLTKIIQNVEKIRKKSDKKILVVLDEFDKGFSLSNQSKAMNVLNNLSKRFNLQILCVSHNYLLIQKIKIVYDLETRSYVGAKNYLEKFN